MDTTKHERLFHGRFLSCFDVLCAVDGECAGYAMLGVLLVKQDGCLASCQKGRPFLCAQQERHFRMTRIFY
jgi:hypothetical protein